MKNIAFVIASVLTFALTGIVSAESVVVAPRPAQVIQQFSQSIPPEPAVAGGAHRHATPGAGCCDMKKEMKPQAKQQGDKSSCCCKK